MIFTLYDYVAIGFVILASIAVIKRGRSGATHIILGSYLLMLLSLGLYRSINIRTTNLMTQPDKVGIFLIQNKALGTFLINAKIRIVAGINLLLGSQIIYGSVLGALSTKNIFYRIRNALQIPLAIIAVWTACIVVRAGPAFFGSGLLVWSATLFSHPVIRGTLEWLPLILTVNILLTILATTTFSTFINISFHIGSKMRSRDAIYVENEPSIRHVVE